MVFQLYHLNVFRVPGSTPGNCTARFVLKLSCAAALKEVMSPAIVNENALLATCRCLTTGWACIVKEKLSAACSRQSLPSFAEGEGDLASSWRMPEQFSACEPSRHENRCEIAIRPVFIVFALWSSGVSPPYYHSVTVCRTVGCLRHGERPRMRLRGNRHSKYSIP